MTNQKAPKHREVENCVQCGAEFSFDDLLWNIKPIPVWGTGFKSKTFVCDCGNQPTIIAALSVNAKERMQKLRTGQLDTTDEPNEEYYDDEEMEAT